MRITQYLLFFLLTVISSHIYAQHPETNEVPSYYGISDEFPDILISSTGRLWIAWCSSREREDGIFAAYRDGTNWGPEISVSMQTNTEWRPRIIEDQQNRIWFFWSADRATNKWDIYARYYSNGMWSSEFQLTTDEETDINQEVMVADDGTIWLAWESFRDGNNEIYYKTYSNDTWSADSRLTSNSQNDFRPVLVQDSQGAVWFIWDSYREHNYNIFYQCYKDGVWSDEAQLTNWDKFDYNPHAAADTNGNVWVTWTSLRRGDGNYKYNTMLWALQGTQRWTVVHSNEYISPGDGDMSRVAVDREGRVWVFWSGLDLKGACYAGNNLEVLSFDSLNYAYGTCPQHQLALGATGGLYVVQEYARLGNAETIGLMYFEDPDPGVHAPAPSLVPAQPENYSPPSPATRPPMRSLDYQGETYYLYYGDTHTHTALSDGRFWPDMAYYRYRDDFAMDWHGVSDHDIVSPSWQSQGEWAYGRDLARRLNNSPVFTTLSGYEYRGGGTTGDRNVYYPNYTSRILRGNEDEWAITNTFEEFKKPGKEGFHIPHHISRDFQPVDWDYHDEITQPVLEISSGHGICEYDFCPGFPTAYALNSSAQDALAKGCKIGFIGSSDLHGIHWMPAAIACTLAPENRIDQIWSSMKNRRTFAIHGMGNHGTFLDYRINGWIMGEEISLQPGSEPVISVDLEMPSAFDRIEIVKNNTNVFTYTGTSPIARFSWTNNVSSASETDWYYLRITRGSSYVWPSPIWVNKDRSPGGITATGVHCNLPADGATETWVMGFVVDTADVCVVDATNQVTFSLSGSGTLLGPNPATPSNGVGYIRYRAGSSPGVATITASSDGLGSQDVQILLGNSNAGPTVHAGQDQTLYWPSNYVALDATVFDDGQPTNGVLTQTWTQVSGAAGVVFDNTHTVDTGVTFPTNDTYVLRLTAGDGMLTNSDTVTITVRASISDDEAPVLNATTSTNRTAVYLSFDELLHSSTAELIDNYAIDHNIIVYAAELMGDAQTVRLVTEYMSTGTTYSLVAADIQDLFNNTMPPTTQAFQCAVTTVGSGAELVANGDFESVSSFEQSPYDVGIDASDVWHANTSIWQLDPDGGDLGAGDMAATNGSAHGLSLLQSLGALDPDTEIDISLKYRLGGSGYVGLRVQLFGVTNTQSFGTFGGGQVGDLLLRHDLEVSDWSTFTTSHTISNTYDEIILQFDGRDYDVALDDISVTLSGGMDTNPPAAAAGFSATGNDGQVSLAWQNPADVDVEGALVLRRVGAPPTGTPADGTVYQAGQMIGDGTVVQVCPGTNRHPSAWTGFVDANVTNNMTYHYALFACDSTPNYAERTTDSSTPRISKCRCRRRRDG